MQLGRTPQPLNSSSTEGPGTVLTPQGSPYLLYNPDAVDSLLGVTPDLSIIHPDQQTHCGAPEWRFPSQRGACFNPSGCQEAGPARLTEALEGHKWVVPGSPGRMNKMITYLYIPIQ